MPIGKRFVKGDPRINRNGRPRNFDELRARAQIIAHEELTAKDGSKILVADAILRSWAKDPKHQRDFIEYAFGKVPDKLETTGLEHKSVLVLHFDHERGITQETNDER